MSLVPERPIQDPEVLQGLDDIATAISSVYASAGCRRVDPAVLQPADEIIDLLGENVRKRVFISSDPTGAEYCLRPDLTIPTCRLYVDGLAGQPGTGQEKLSYLGSGFRLSPPNEPRAREFTQAGIEFLGPAEEIRTDATVFSLTVEACAKAGLHDYEVQFGDLGIFAALIDQLPVSAAWRERLKRNYWRPDYFRTLIERLGGAREGLSSPLGDLLEKVGEADARSLMHEVLSLANIKVIGGRTVNEITERLIDKTKEAADDPLPQELVDVVLQFLDIQGTPEDALGAVADLGEQSGLTLTPVVELARDRFAQIRAQGPETAAVLARAKFSTVFGRHLEYYTGFVFELLVPALGPERQVAGGGRYDRLLKVLSAGDGAPACGAAIRLERLYAAIREQGAD